MTPAMTINTVLQFAFATLPWMLPVLAQRFELFPIDRLPIEQGNRGGQRLLDVEQLDPELGLLLAREAYRVRPGAETEAVRKQAQEEGRHHLEGKILAGHRGARTGVEDRAPGARLV